MARGPDYDAEAIRSAFASLGIDRGDILFSHTSVGMLGRPPAPLDHDLIADLFLTAVSERIGDDGGWLLPAFTYSYTKDEVFDPDATPPTPAMGLLPLAFWRRPEFTRSLDPIFSVIGWGEAGRTIATGAGAGDCFGDDSIWALLIEHDALLVNIGIGIHSTLIHHVERRLGVPYRTAKTFTGTTISGGAARESSVEYAVRPLDDDRYMPYFMRLDADVKRSGVCRRARLGRGEVSATRVRDLSRLIEEGLERDPFYLVKGPAEGDGGPA